MIETMEIRWFWDTPLSQENVRWLESLYQKSLEREPERTDCYLRLPETDAIGIKLREGALEVKRRIGELIEGPKDPLKLEQWIKLRGDNPDLEENLLSADWLPVRKQRLMSWWMLSEQGIQPAHYSSPEDTVSQVELAEILVGEQIYTTLGVEAAGPQSRTADLVFRLAETLLEAPSGPDFDKGKALSYPGLLRELASRR